MNNEPRLRKFKMLLVNVAEISLVSVIALYLLPFLGTVALNNFRGLSEITHNAFFLWLGVAVAFVIWPLGAVIIVSLILTTIQRRKKTRNQEQQTSK